MSNIDSMPEPVLDFKPPVLSQSLEKIEESDRQAPAAMPHLKAEALPGLAGELVSLATQNSEADPAAVLATMLNFFAASIGSRPHLMIGDTKHYARLDIAICGNSSRARKGTSAQPVERIFKRAQELGTLDPLNISPGPLSSGEGLVYTVRDESKSINKKTKEMEVDDEGVSDKRLLVMEGELGGGLAAMSREGNTLSAIIRTAWDSGNISPLTKSNRIQTTGAHICIVGHITRQELGKLLKSSDIWNGFANRFLWVAARRQKLVPMPAPMDDAAVDNLARSLSLVVSHAQKANRVMLSPNVVAAWSELYPQLTKDEPGIFGVITARAEAQVLRLALIYALMDSSNNRDVMMIQENHLIAAMAFWDYCCESARYLFGAKEADPLANKILTALSKGEKTQSEINQLFNGHQAGGKLKGILEQLQSAGRIEQRKEGGGGKGKGAPKIIWSMHESFKSSVEELEELEE